MIKITKFLGWGMIAITALTVIAVITSSKIIQIILLWLSFGAVLAGIVYGAARGLEKLVAKGLPVWMTWMILLIGICSAFILWVNFATWLKSQFSF